MLYLTIIHPYLQILTGTTTIPFHGVSVFTEVVLEWDLDIHPTIILPITTAGMIHTITTRIIIAPTGAIIPVIIHTGMHPHSAGA